MKISELWCIATRMILGLQSLPFIKYFMSLVFCICNIDLVNMKYFGHVRGCQSLQNWLNSPVWGSNMAMWGCLKTFQTFLFWKIMSLIINNLNVYGVPFFFLIKKIDYFPDFWGPSEYIVNHNSILAQDTAISELQKHL